MLERLQKFMSGAGVASRRHAEQMILSGLVKVNGEVVRELGTKIDPDKDTVLVKGKRVFIQQPVYLMLNKPKRYITTRSDPRRRRTVYDLLPPELKNIVWPIGRLDFNTEGLLLLTNDGELTQQLAHPSYEHEKEYEVQLDKELTAGRIEKIKQGMRIDDKVTAPAKVRTEGTTVYLTIHEGINRQIRKMFAVLGYTVRNLKRIRIGRVKLGDLPSGEFRRLNRQDITKQ